MTRLTKILDCYINCYCVQCNNFHSIYEDCGEDDSNTYITILNCLKENKYKQKIRRK